MSYRQAWFWMTECYSRRIRLGSVFCMFIALFLVIPVTHAQDSIPDRALLPPSDSSGAARQNEPVEQTYWKPGYFDSNPVEEVSGDQAVPLFEAIKSKYDSPDFNYSEKALNRLSWWDRLKRRVDEFLKSLLPDWSISATTLVLRILAVLGICALIFIIYRLIASGKKVFVREQREKMDPPGDFIEQHLETTNIQAYLEDALAQKDYTLAVRYLHLINLQALAKQEIIVWDYRKTNHDFLLEISSDALRAEFEQTNSIYEYIWFGNFAIDEHQFLTYRDLFIHFKNHIG